VRHPEVQLAADVPLMCNSHNFRSKLLTLKILAIFCAKDMHISEIGYDDFSMRG
jgi:hypothetical protein